MTKVLDGGESSSESSHSDETGVQKPAVPISRQARWFGESGTALRVLRKQESWLCSVSFANGLTNATKVLIPLYLADRGVSVQNIGLIVGLDDLGLTTKIFAGIVSDKFDLFGYGHRRPWAFIGLWVTALSFVFRGVLDIAGFDYGWYLFLLIAESMIREFYDKPISAYTVEVIHSNKYGRIQALTGAFRGISLLIGFGITSILSESGRFGWAAVFIFNGVMLCIASLFTFTVPRAKADNHFQWRAFRELKRANVVAHAVFLYIGAIPTNIMLTAAPLFIRDLTGGNVGTTVFLAIAAVFVGIGSFSAWPFIDKYRTRLMYSLWFIVGLGAVGASFFLLATLTGIVQLMYLWAVFQGIATGAILSANGGLVMLEIQDHSIAASLMAIFGMIASAGSLTGGVMSGYIINGLGYSGTVGIMLMFLAISAPVVYLIFRGTDYRLVPEDGDDVTAATLELGGIPPKAASSAGSELEDVDEDSAGGGSDEDGGIPPRTSSRAGSEDVGEGSACCDSDEDGGNSPRTASSAGSEDGGEDSAGVADEDAGNSTKSEDGDRRHGGRNSDEPPPAYEA